MYHVLQVQLCKCVLCLCCNQTIYLCCITQTAGFCTVCIYVIIRGGIRQGYARTVWAKTHSKRVSFNITAYTTVLHREQIRTSSIAYPTLLQPVQCVIEVGRQLGMEVLVYTYYFWLARGYRLGNIIRHTGGPVQIQAFVAPCLYLLFTSFIYNRCFFCFYYYQSKQVGAVRYLLFQLCSKRYVCRYISTSVRSRDLMPRHGIFSRNSVEYKSVPSRACISQLKLSEGANTYVGTPFLPRHGD